MSVELEELILSVVEVVRRVGAYISSQKYKVSLEEANIKGRNELVTEIDRTAEQMLIDQLTKLRKSEILSEEFNPHVDVRKVDSCWIIDPLDGTTNYVHGLPFYAVSVALWQEGTLQLGVIYDVERRLVFYAWRGGGAWRNGKQIRVSSTERKQQWLIATGFPYQDFSRMRPYMQVFETLMRETQGVRRMGSAALDLAWTACGSFDGFYEYNLKPWDVAAGGIIIEEAGGRVSDFRGGSNWLMGREIVAGSPACHEYLLALCSKYFVVEAAAPRMD